MMKYKALDLYEISSRKGKRKRYQLEVEQWAKIQAFVIQDRISKKAAIQNSLVKSPRTTELILTNNYIVWLVDKNNKPIIEKFGKTKDILEEFNKEISKSKYNKYLHAENEVSLPELEERKMIVNEVFTLKELKESVRNSRTYLMKINPLDTKTIIKEEDAISTAIRTVNLDLDNEMDSGKVLDTINILKSLNLPMAQNTIAKAIDRLDSIYNKDAVVA